MALVDLLDKIESFDYNQVGKPQTFEANGGTVTGQQSFERPIEVPLPVQETLLGYGERTSAQNFLQNAVIDGLDTSIVGFTKEMTETQFQFIVGETSNFEPFYSQGTYGFQNPADFQFPTPVNFFDNTYVKGFTENTSPAGIGPSDNSDFNIISGETSTFNVSTKFGDDTYQFPFNTNFFEDTYAKGFNSNRSPEGIGPSSTTNFSPIISDPGDAARGTSTYNDSVTFVGLSEADLPELQTPTWSNVFEVTAIPTNTVPTTQQIVGDDTNPAQTYAWTADGSGETSAFAVNFFDKDGENPYVSGFTLDISPEGIGPGETKMPNNFIPSYGGYTFVDTGIQTFQSRLNLPFSAFLMPSLEEGADAEQTAFRRQSSRFRYETEEGVLSNFLDEHSKIVTDFLTKTDKTIYHKTDGENENYKVSARAGRGFPNNFYRPKVTGDGASRTLPFELAEVAKDRFDDENRIMLPPVNADGEADGTNIGSRPYGLEFSDPANGAKELISGYASYVRDMSSTDGDQPFIVRRMGNDWGVDFLGDPGFIQNLAGGFMRTPGSPTHNFGGRLHREATDLKRKIKFVSTSDGASFVVKQFLLQSQNRTMESRIYNPLSLASVQGLVGIERNYLFGTTYEGILGGSASVGAGDPPPGSDGVDTGQGGNSSTFTGVIDFVKKLIPNSPIQQYIDKYLGRKEDIDGIAPIPTSRNKWQALYGEWGDVTSGTADIEKATETATKKKADPPEAQTDQSQAEEGGFDLGQAASDLAAGAADFAAGALKKLKSLFPGAKELKFSMHNPNQYYKIDPLNIYGKGGADAAKSLMDRLTSASDRHTTVTFAKKKNSLQQKKEQYDYHYNLYGAIPTEKSKEREYSGVNVTKADDTKKKKADRYPQGITAKNYHKQIQSWNNSDPKQRDLVNGAPLMDEDRYDSTKIPDFVDFKFRVKSYGDYESGEGDSAVTNTSKNKILIFSAIINSLSDAVSPEYNEVRYLGRPDKFYTYNGVDRDISVSFTLYPKTRQEFPFLAEKLNYLVGLTYPQYSATNAMLAPYVDLTLGDMFNNQPGYISSLNVNVQDNTTWEIDAFQFPKHITCDLTFRLIGRHVPHQFGKHYDLPWLSVSEDAKNYGSTIFSNDFNNPNLTMYGPTYRIPGKGVGSEWTEVNALNQNLLTNAYMAPLDVSKRPGQDDSSGAGEADE